MPNIFKTGKSMSNKFSKSNVIFARRVDAMTIVEMLIVVSIVSVLTVALYHALSGGIRVWQRSHRAVVEEDVVVFFEKFNHDIHNAFFFAKLPVSGDASRFSFPTMIITMAEQSSGLPEGETVEQLGRVEYFFDEGQHALMRRQSNYSQAMSESWGASGVIIPSVSKIEFRYYYLTARGEQVSAEVLNVVPSGIEVFVETQDWQGIRKMSRFFDVPLGS